MALPAKTQGRPGTAGNAGRSAMPLLDTATIKKVEPFAALISVSSLLVGLLYVAGFSYRWAYFYNFGVQHVVNKLGFQSFLIAAFELIRTWPNLLVVVIYVLVPILLFNAVLTLLHRAAKHENTVGKLARFCLDTFGLSTSLVVDLLRAAILVFGTSKAGYVVGYTAYSVSVANTTSNPLPAVTVLYQGKDAEAVKGIRCGAGDDWPDALIGDTRGIDLLHQGRRTCADGKRVWRLLYRDDESLYIFAGVMPEAAKDTRPLTLILPNGKNTVLITE